MSSAAPLVLVAVAGGMVAVAAREGILATPALASWLREAVEPLRRAGREGYEPTEPERRRLAGLGALVLLASGVYLAGPGPGLAVAVAGPAAATWVTARRRARYRRAVESGIPEIAAALADALAGGRSIRGALAAVSTSLEGAPAVELSRVRADLELGAPTSQALASLAHRLRSTRVDALVAALLSQQLGGGDLASLLRRHADAAAQRNRISSDARAATAQARFTGMLVVAMPAGAAVFAELLEPGFIGRLTGDGVALAALACAAALQLTGFAAIRRLSRVDE